jgi:hypothetical protein
MPHVSLKAPNPALQPTCLVFGSPFHHTLRVFGAAELDRLASNEESS